MFGPATRGSLMGRCGACSPTSARGSATPRRRRYGVPQMGIGYRRRPCGSTSSSCRSPGSWLSKTSMIHPGVGSYWGEVNGSIFTALGCVAVVTNGAVRDLVEMRAIGIQAFAGSVAVSHAYVHLVRVGDPVIVGGLSVRPGDLLHGDQHGVLSIPFEIAAALAAATRRVEAEERELIEFCRSPNFSANALLE